MSEIEEHKKHYSSYRHPEWKANHEKWVYAQKVYDGTAYDRKKFDTNEIQQFIPKKVQRESAEAYLERLQLLDPQMHFPTGIDSLVGVMFDAEKEADRKWQGEGIEGLGDPDDTGSIAYRLSRNADGDNTNWDFIPKQVAIKFSLKQTMWGLVDGRPKDEAGESVGDARFKVIDPECVINWYEQNGRLTWVLVKERIDMRDSYKDDPDLGTAFVEYLPDGWRRFRIDDKGNEHDLGSGSYSFFSSVEKKNHILPIFRSQIPLPRNPGYLWAKKANAIQNFESRLDFAHMTITFALLQVATGDQDDFMSFLQDFKKGMNVLNIDPNSSRDHKFLQQDSSFFDASEARLGKKIKDFYKNMFKDYGDAAAQRTAQEIRLESKSGIEAYLSLLVGAIDEFENEALWRISQVYFPKQTKVWGDAHVERTADFAPDNIDKVLSGLQNRYLGGKPVPLPPEGLAQVIKRIAMEDNIDLSAVSDEQIMSLAQQISINEMQFNQLQGQMGLG